MIVLKRLSDAVRRRRQYPGRSSAARPSTRTAAAADSPSRTAQAQQALIRKALAAAGVAPGDIDYMEAHGTGTALGDPIEVEALGAVLGQGRASDHPLIMGSVKTNIGHPESAAGIAGMIKVVLAMQHEEIPPHLHLRERSPRIPWPAFEILIPAEPVRWPAIGRPHLAGVSAFGLSGTNAHVVLEGPPMTRNAPPTRHPASGAAGSIEPIERSYHILTLSAKDEPALKQLAGRLAQRLVDETNGSPSRVNGAALADICYTANTGRAQFAHRLAAVGATPESIKAGLAHVAVDLAQSQSPPQAAMVSHSVAGAPRPKVAFLFTGQGAQYAGMARQLYDAQPAFRRALDQCDAWLRLHLSMPLLSVLYPDPDGKALSLLDDTAFTQPALFALEYALVAVWKSWGIEPSAVLGHSVGEYVAACIAGVFSPEEGLKLIAQRGRLMQQLPSGGQMAAVFADAARVAPALAPYAAHISIAAINGPDNVVISGAGPAVQAALGDLARQGIKSRRLNVSHAFHSPLIEPILDDFERAAREVAYAPPNVALISNVSGGWAKPEEVTTAAYWRRHARAPVQFASGIETLREHGVNVFVEIGPTPTLTAMGQRCLPEDFAATWVHSLRKGRDDWQQMLESLAQLYARGVEVDWAGFDRGYPRQRVVLPTYPFQRERYWFSLPPPEPAGPGRQVQAARSQPAIHPLLGRRLLSPSIQDIVYESQLSEDQPPYLADHQLYGTTVFPGAAYLEMALAAATALGRAPVALREVKLLRALALTNSEGAACTVQLILKAEEDGEMSFAILSLDDDGDWLSSETGASPAWIRHATGRIGAGHAEALADPEPIAWGPTPAPDFQPMPIEPYYQQLYSLGVNYGPNFKGIVQLWRHTEREEALAQINLPAGLDAATYCLHPALLDACFQALGAALPSEHYSAEGSAYLPVALDRLRLYRPGEAKAWCRVCIRPQDGNPPLVDPASRRQPDALVGDLDVFDESGLAIAVVEGLHLIRASREVVEAVTRRSYAGWMYEVAWLPQSLVTDRAPELMPARPKGKWIILADDEGPGPALVARLQSAGEQCVVVRPGKAFARCEPGTWLVNPEQPADFARLLDEASAAGDMPLRGVVHLWSLPRPPAAEAAGSTLRADATSACVSVLHLTQALAARAPDRPDLHGMWIVTRGAQPVIAGQGIPALTQAPLWGLGRTIALEHPELRATCVDLDPAPEADDSQSLFDELRSESRENQVAFRQNTRYVARLKQAMAGGDVNKARVEIEVKPRPLADGQAEAQALRLEIQSRGILDNLELRPVTRRPPGPGEVELRVRATGLNFRDVLNALDLYPGDAGLLGNECAGSVVAVGEGVDGLRVGDAVIAIAAGSFSTFATTRAEFVVPKPDSISFEEAATIPIAFLTAYYGLRHLAHLAPGERVLIHAAAGGVGLAAVQLAQQAGAVIFATAGSDDKRVFLRALGIQHVMDSRTLDFADQVLDLTQGEGVDVILNALTGEFIPKGLSILRAGGRFLEIGKRDIWSDEDVTRAHPHVLYLPYDLGDVWRDAPALVRPMLQELMTSIQLGRLKPLPSQSFPLEQAASAFRFMAQAKHIGKIVVTQEPGTPAAARRTEARHSALPLQPNATYLVTGGLGALGLQVARWLVERGARHVVLAGRHDPSPAARQAIERLQHSGAQVMAAQADISEAEQVRALLAAIEQTMPPLRGIVHAAGVLDDGVLLQQNRERFETVMAPKIWGAWLLHDLTRDLPLDFFVLYSSAAALFGSAGQGNYAAANAFLDALAHQRRAEGLPALSINWGAWAEAGMAATVDHNRRQWTQRGFGLIAPDQGIQALGQALRLGIPQVAVLPIDWPQLLQHFPDGSVPAFLSDVARAVESRTPAKESIRESVQPPAGMTISCANGPPLRLRSARDSWSSTSAGMCREPWGSPSLSPRTRRSC